MTSSAYAILVSFLLAIWVVGCGAPQPDEPVSATPTAATQIALETPQQRPIHTREPMATVEFKDQPPVKYVDLTPEKMRKIFTEHVLWGRMVAEYALAVGSETMY